VSKGYEFFLLRWEFVKRLERISRPFHTCPLCLGKINDGKINCTQC
jgi:hypothetical protein